MHYNDTCKENQQFTGVKYNFFLKISQFVAANSQNKRSLFQYAFSANIYKRGKNEHSDRRTGIKGKRQNPIREHGQTIPGFVAEACKNIASHCKDLSSEQAYIFGLLHDIGRYAGVSSERHLIDGYRYCMERGWEKAAQICISHAFMIQDIATSIGEFDVSDEDYLFMKEFVANAVYDDYDRLVQLCDALAMPTGFCLLEKRFVDVTIRYGVHTATIDRWKKILEIKEQFENQIGCSIYSLLPGIVENSFR